MNDMTPTREQREAKLEGMGCKRKRVEDIRFTQGKGNYVDDLKLPGMLHGDFVRSPLRPCAGEVDQLGRGAEGARRARRDHRRDAEDGQPRLDADAGRRRADGAGRRQGAVPEPGGRLRRRHRPLRRRRRHQRRRGRIRAAAGRHRSVQGDGCRRAGAARGSRRQDLRRARAAQASQPRLRVDGRRQGSDRCRLPQGRGDDQGDDLLPSRRIPRRSRPASASAPSTRSRAS